MLRNMRSDHTQRIQGRRACARVAHRPPAWWLVVVGTSDRGSSGVDTDMVCRPIRSVSLTWELDMYTNSMSCEFELTVTPPPPVVCVAVHGSPCGSPGTMLWAASRPSVGGPNVERRVLRHSNRSPLSIRGWDRRGGGRRRRLTSFILRSLRRPPCIQYPGREGVNLRAPPSEGRPH